jgi:hypothetical protein
MKRAHTRRARFRFLIEKRVKRRTSPTTTKERETTTESTTLLPAKIEKPHFAKQTCPHLSQFFPTFVRRR